MLAESMSAPPSFWASVISWFTPTVLFVFLNLTIGTIFFTSSLNKPSHVDPNNTQRHHQDDADPRRLARSPSMLQRIKSVNFYAYRSQEPEKSPDSDTHFAPHQIAETEQIDSRPPFQFPRSPSVLQRLKCINLQSYFSQEPTLPIESEPVLHKSPETDKTHSDSEEENEVEHEAGEERSRNEELEEVYSQLKVARVSRTKSDTEPASGEIPTKLPRKMRKSASTKSAFAHFEEEDIVEKRRPETVREGKVKDPDEEVDAKADDFINRFKQQLKLQRIDSIIRYNEVIGRGSGK